MFHSSDHHRCSGCGAKLRAIDGPVHAYMTSSPACYEAFTELLAAEYINPALLQTHRLTVDTYAVQHPGDSKDRRCIQSVGLHLSRLYVQLAHPMPPKETNAVMLDFSHHKSSLIALKPPTRFCITVADVAPFSGGTEHPKKVREWATKTWEDWSEHHEYIKSWVHDHSKQWD